MQKYFRHRYQRILVQPGVGLYNYKCFWNAAQKVFDDPEKNLRVVEVIQFKGQWALLHYVNWNPETDEYIDNTLGYQAEQMEYYRIRLIPPPDLPQIEDHFGAALDYWDSVFLKWYHKLAGIERAL